MLSGIKTGKRKKKAPPPASSGQVEDRTSESGNDAAAAFLRHQLATGEPPSEGSSAPATVLIPDRHTASKKKEEDMTVQELLVHEKSLMSLAEQESRHIVRQKNMKRPRIIVDSDNEEVTDDHWKQPPDHAKAARRDHNRQLTSLRRTEGVTHSCWWWVESKSFSLDRHLIAASAQVTLVLHSRGLIPGKHFYLVPIPHAPAWTSCEENVWAEARNFQASLRRMAKANNESVLFWETVLPRGGGVWQTKMDVLFVPTTVAQDAPLYFRSALAEQAQEFGTHQKPIAINSQKKSLKASVPSNFDYFYVEYDESHGHVQMIEHKSFPKDFGADTVAGMMELDPLRFRRKNNKAIDEDKLKRDFLEMWTPYDWTASPTGSEVESK